MVVIARGFGFSMTTDAAADGDDKKRNGDAIAVLIAVRRSINELDGRDKPHAIILLLEKMTHATKNNKKLRRSPTHSPDRLIFVTFGRGTGSWMNSKGRR